MLCHYYIFGFFSPLTFSLLLTALVRLVLARPNNVVVKRGSHAFDTGAKNNKNKTQKTNNKQTPYKQIQKYKNQKQQ